MVHLSWQFETNVGCAGKVMCRIGLHASCQTLVQRLPRSPRMWLTVLQSGHAALSEEASGRHVKSVDSSVLSASLRENHDHSV